MFKNIKKRIEERNRNIAMQMFTEKYGPETEFCERRIMNVSEKMFKVFDPGTDHVMYFSHTLFGPMSDEI